MGGWDVNIVTISQNQTSIVESDMSGFKEKNAKDYWVEEGNKVVRVHNKKRSKLFDPRETPHPTIQDMLKDERKTLRTNTETMRNGRSTQTTGGLTAIISTTMDSNGQEGRCLRKEVESNTYQRHLLAPETLGLSL